MAAKKELTLVSPNGKHEVVVTSPTQETQYKWLGYAAKEDEKPQSLAPQSGPKPQTPTPTAKA